MHNPMTHIYRFFGEKVNDGSWRLADEEVTHALKVLRLNDGDSVEVMDGCGLTGQGTLKIESKSKALAVDVTETWTPQDNFCRWILLGALKPGDVDDLIAPLVELGADKIIIYRQADTPHFRISDGASERWQRLVRAALKQSKRPWTVEVQAVGDLDAALALAAPCTYKWMLDHEAKVDLLAKSWAKPEGQGVAALIGGEKGLSAAERAQALKAGFEGVRLGPWVLRARTAAQAAAAFLGMMRV
jgi:16S rRNA (uracil1498-N3)-methyltransferase